MKDVKFSWGCIGAGSAILLFIAALANNVRHDTNMAGAADAVEHACLATTDHTCASRTNLAANKSCLVCVYQPLRPIPLEGLRADRTSQAEGVAARRGKELDLGTTTGLHPARPWTSAPARQRPRRARASWATEAVAAKRRIYVDLGANLYESSIGNWFRASYPDAGTYKVYAFEAEHKYDDSYAGHPDVTLLHYAVSTANGTIPWGHMAKKGGRPRSGARRAGRAAAAAQDRVATSSKMARGRPSTSPIGCGGPGRRRTTSWS